MDDPESMRIILGIAASYDLLAERTETAEKSAFLKVGTSRVSMAA
jgi:hypothetical protein